MPIRHAPNALEVDFEDVNVSTLPLLTLRRSGGGSLSVVEGQWFRVRGSSAGSQDQP